MLRNAVLSKTYTAVKKSLVKIRIICLYKEVTITFRNKGDLDRVIKTKTSI